MSMLSETDKACVLALVYAHVIDADEYLSWVPPYTCARKDKRSKIIYVWIGGHYRMQANYKRLLKALPCTCKFTDISRTGAYLLC